MDPSIERWRQTGRIAFWRYASARSSLTKAWHLTADQDGMADLETVIGLIRAARYPARIRFHVTDLAGRGDPMNAREFSKSSRTFTLAHRVDWPASVWRTGGDYNDVTLDVGPASLSDFEAGLAERREVGNGDFSVGGGDEGWPLWLWPWPRA